MIWGWFSPEELPKASIWLPMLWEILIFLKRWRNHHRLFRTSLQYCSLANALRKNWSKIESNSDGRKTEFFKTWFFRQKPFRKTKIVSVNHVSNALGIINPIEEIIAKVRKNSSALMMIDGAQSVPYISRLMFRN